MYKWECKLLVGTPGIPKTMVTEAESLLTAIAYFETFGKIVSTPRIIDGK